MSGLLCPTQHMRQPLLRRSRSRPKCPLPGSDSTLPIGIKRTSTIMGSQTLEALMLRSTISCRLEWKVEGIVGRANIKEQIAQRTALDSGRGMRVVGCDELDSS